MNRLVEKLWNTTARRPSGWLGKFLFSYPKVINPAFPIVLKKLDLRSDDAYLELACGAGQLLQLALQTVRRAAAIDHSPDMVELSRRRNQQAVEKGIAEIVEGKAESLSWPDEQFTCAACVNAFFFMVYPDRVLGELCRVLKPGGRLALSTYADRPSLYRTLFLRYYTKVYTDDEMSAMLRQAGFTTVEVRSKGLTQVCYAVK